MAPIIQLKVIPSSGRQELIVESTGIKCYLKNPPERGKANQELIAFLAHKLKIPQRNISIISGMATRNKKIVINTPLDLDEIYTLLRR